MTALAPLSLDEGPAHLAVKQVLRARLGHEWKLGDRLPPVSQLARELRVGQNNAHRAVRGLVDEGLLVSRRRLGTFVRRVPRHDLPRADRKESALPLRDLTFTLAFHGDAPVPFVEQMMEGFREAIEAAGAGTRRLSIPLRSPELPPSESVGSLAVFNPSGNFCPPSNLKHFAAVSTSDHMHPELLARADMVGVDQYQGGALAGRALRDAGCERVLFVGRHLARGSERFDVTSSARLHGFEAGFGRPLADHEVRRVFGYSLLSGGDALRHYLTMEPRPQGVFLASDDLALGFLAAARGQGLYAKRDFQLVGFDGQDRPGESGEGERLTTVRVPAREMGRRAAELVVERVKDPERLPQRVLASCTLTSGDTCRTS